MEAASALPTEGGKAVARLRSIACHTVSAVRTNVREPLRQLVPSVNDPLLETEWARGHLTWMAKKDELNQDMFLLGSHGPLRRHLAFKFCELSHRECEYVALTADTSEADLKSRRELRRSNSQEGSGNLGGSLSVVWEDQPVVRAALLGRVLVLEGLEKAERNVLPVLNNLLENREMQLEDGRFLVAPQRYDALLVAQQQQQLKNKEEGGGGDLQQMGQMGGLVRVSERFRVIAIGVPSPPFPGNPLDPPLRSRFSARHVARAPAQDLMFAIRTRFAPHVPLAKLQRLLAFFEAIWALGEQQGTSSGAESKAIAFSSLVYPCEQAIFSACELLEKLPSIGVMDALHRVFPSGVDSGLLDGEAQSLISAVLQSTTEALGSEAHLGLLFLSSTAIVGVKPAKAYDMHERGDLNEVDENTQMVTNEHRTRVVQLQFACQPSDTLRMTTTATAGTSPPRLPEMSRLLPGQRRVLAEMLASAAVGRDVCLIGPRGEGKTFIAQIFGATLGYEAQIETLFLFDDMSARDLFTRRSTNAHGESTWQPTPLTTAMLHGHLCVLDGLHRLRASSLSVLARLLQDRECQSPDGTRWISPQQWELLTTTHGLKEADLIGQGLRRVHPAFRVVGLAIPRAAKNRKWLSNEVLQLFHFFVMSCVGEVVDFAPFVQATVPNCPASIVTSLVRVRRLLRAAAVDRGSPLWVGSDDQTRPEQFMDHERDYLKIPDAALDCDSVCDSPLPPGAEPIALSLRSILRAARRAATAPANVNANVDVGTSVEAALMADFMPLPERAAVRAIIKAAGLELESRNLRVSAAQGIVIKEPTFRGPDHCELCIGSDLLGSVRAVLTPPKNPSLVPDTVFFDIPQAKLVLMEMLRDILSGEHMLLMGNQGVGKNKITDKLLMLMHREREYVQLHRDTTVGSLTLLPSLRNGVVSFEDSPLVKAMRHGRILVIDEFDKAPTEVVIVLKALLEDGDILLGDGRRFVSANHPMACHGQSESLYGINIIHPGFLVIALANRPGFPFLGNDFFREMGDSFACHAVQNPDVRSEIDLLQRYAPQLSRKLLGILCASFSELREATDAGTLSYPYSTRELVAIVRHLAAFPQDSIGSVLENVFAFDVYDQQLRDFIFGVFSKHGVPLTDTAAAGQIKSQILLAQSIPLPPPRKVARILPQREQASKSIAMNSTRGIVSHLYSATSFEAEPFVLSVDNGSPAWVCSWRAISPEIAEAIGGVQDSLLQGRAGAEWTPLTWHSARAHTFSEEELWFRIACVTRDGVMIEGSDPQQGSWLGDMIGFQSAEDCICILTTMQCLYVADTKNMKYRKLPIAVATGGGLMHRAKYAAGSTLVTFEDSLLTYDQHNEVLIRIWPSLGRMSALALCRPAAGLANSSCVCAGMMEGDQSLLVLFAVGGCEVLLVHPSQDEGGKAKCRKLTLSNAVVGVRGIESVACLSSKELGLMTCDGQIVELSFNGMPLCDDTLCEVRCIGTTPVPCAKCVHIASPTELSHHFVQHGKFAATFASRECTGLEVLAFDRPADIPHVTIAQNHALKPVSGWHAPSHSVINVFSDSISTWTAQGNEYSSSTISVAHGKVFVEIVDPVSLQVRVVVLTEFPGKFIGGKGTGGDLTARALLLTDAQKQREAAKKETRLGMAACVDLCTLQDGRLGLLFADGHVRILEVRPEKLAADQSLCGFLDFEGQQVTTGSVLSRHLNDGVADDDSRDGDGDGNGTGNGNGGNGDGRANREGSTARNSSRHTTTILSQMQRQSASDAQNVLRQARELVARASSGARVELDLNELEVATYDEIYESVEPLISQLRVVLQSVEAKEKERVWLRNKTSGEMDDARLVDLAIGEKNVFKQRGIRDESLLVQRLPKRLSVVVDVSGSMAYFNSDLRLDRLCATVVMLMEALVGLEHKYTYEIVGHSGETHHLPLVDFGVPPRNRKERLAVVQSMVAHAAVCQSGDNTLAAATRAVRDVRSEEADDFFVFLVSDANLEGYGVTSSSLAAALLADSEVNAYAIFIAEPEVASEMAERLPAGHAHLVLENDGMPLLLKDIFSRALLRSRL